ncbi:helix-turn-helix transcriptional regulator [Chitinibacter mangrovi]|uniref:helix-turn-helix transcriptional regulator n=1 Tax=Chitinibacter mangrovi TaxID=3153927 RepID=UPI003D812665
MERRLVRVAQLTGKGGILGISRSTLLRMIARGEFPAPMKIGFIIAWDITDVNNWIDQHKIEL